MFGKNEVMLVLLCCLFFFSMSCVCAGDSDNVTVVDFHVNDVSVAGLNPKGTFADLQNEINNAKYGSVLDLNRDYYANGGSTIQLDKDLIIDGHGHTLDCEKVCSAFHSVRGNFVLRNLNIINGYSKDCGGAVYVCGDTDRCPSFINCTFSNNEALNNGGAISNQGQRVILYSYEFSYYPIDVKNCKFINNVAKNSGGAIESMGTLTVYNSLFESNSAENNCGAISSIFNADIHDSSFYRNVAKDGGAGAVCSKFLYLERCLFSENSADEDGGAVDVTTLEYANCTFESNSAGESGGAIYAENINSFGNDTSFFINNVASDGSGGAIYSDSVYIKTDTIFSGNHAYVDGGAIYAAASGAVVNNCLFEYNVAEGSWASQCCGGAIRGKCVISENCIYRKNYAYDYGGAIYAESLVLEGFSCFEDNTAYDNCGGAIYTNILSVLYMNCIRDAEFSGNSAGEDGGAIYINDECWVTFSNCVFNNNHCGDEGGAIYLDSASSHLTLVNNVFKGNNAGNQGHCVFNCGNYDMIYNNFWDENPSSSNNQLIEWKFWTSNEHHIDSNPSNIDFSVVNSIQFLANKFDLYSHVSDSSNIIKVSNIDSDVSVYNDGVDLISTENIIDNSELRVFSATSYFNFRVNCEDYFYNSGVISYDI